ncbi:MAG: DUF998 domain-containing protein [Methanobacterium sp.]|nr:DUF998 domain-containing protein [Methanobacterium sp.]
MYCDKKNQFGGLFKMNIESNQTAARQRLYALCGIIAPIFFTIMVIIESLLRPGFSQIYSTVSELGLGHLAILQIMNFVIFGFLLICFTVGFSRYLKTRSGKTVTALLITFSIAVMLAGVAFLFQWTSPYNAVILAHSVASIIGFYAIFIAQILTWQALKGSDQDIWRNYRIYSLISGFVTLIVLFYIPFSPYQGLFERVFIAVWLIWIEVTAIKLYRLSKSRD